MLEGEKYWIEFYRNLLGWENVYNWSDGGEDGWTGVNRMLDENPEIRQESARKAGDTNEQKYGLRNAPMMTPEARQKVYDKMAERYDGDIMGQCHTEEGHAKKLDHERENHGGVLAFHSGDAKERSIKTRSERYGDPFGQCHTEEVRAKVLAINAANGNGDPYYMIHTEEANKRRAEIQKANHNGSLPCNTPEGNAKKKLRYIFQNKNNPNDYWITTRSHAGLVGCYKELCELSVAPAELVELAKISMRDPSIKKSRIKYEWLYNNEVVYIGMTLQARSLSKSRNQKWTRGRKVIVEV